MVVDFWFCFVTNLVTATFLMLCQDSMFTYVYKHFWDESLLEARAVSKV